MEESDLMESAVAYTKRLLNQGARARKSLGQNFLIDDGVIHNIVNMSDLGPSALVVEIGAGLGVLTRVLARQVDRLWAVELEEAKVKILESELADLPVTIVKGDALKLDLHTLWGEEQGVLIGNLPYYITSPLLMHFLEQSENLRQMTVMVQKEVADRLGAVPGGKAYGVLSVAVQLAAEVEKLFDVPPHAFRPQPKVTSAVVRLKLRPYPNLAVEKHQLLLVVKAAFSQRRKTLGNSLSAGLGADKSKVRELLESVGIDEGRRAETLSIEEFQEITRAWIGLPTGESAELN